MNHADSRIACARIAYIAVLYQRYFARQHGVSNLMSGTEVYAFMELSTLLKRVLAVSI